MTIAITGLRSGRSRAPSENAGRWIAAASVDTRRPRRSGDATGQMRVRLVMDAAHEVPDLLDIGRVALKVGDDLAAIHDEDAVGEREDLVEIG